MNTRSDLSAESLLISCGLPADFLDQILNKSDWAMIIKLHAIFEAVLSSHIIKSLRTPEIESVIANLDFNHVKSGKVALAKALGLLEKREVTFLRGLSELRNRLVHDIKNVQFSVKEYAEGMSTSEKNKFKTEFGSAIFMLNNGENRYQELLTADPRQLIFLAGYSCLLSLQFNLDRSLNNPLVEALMKHFKRESKKQ